MNVKEARDLIGCKVVYRAPHVSSGEKGDEGVITSVNDTWVFVRYGSHTGSEATPADCLTAVSTRTEQQQ